MSKSEDYLDRLLNSIANGDESQADEEEAMLSAGEEDTLGMESEAGFSRNAEEAEFLRAFEEELLADEDTDDFLRQFESELTGNRPGEGAHGQAASKPEVFSRGPAANEPEEGMRGQAVSEPAKAVDRYIENGRAEYTFLDDLDDIVSSVKENIKDKEEIGDSGEADIMVDTLGENDQDIMELLKSEGSFFDMEDTSGPAGEAAAPASMGLDGLSDDFGMEEFANEEVEPADSAREETGKKAKKQGGFFNRLSRIFFGESEDEKEAAGEKVPEKEAAKTPMASSADIGEFSAENLEILQALEGTPAEAEQSAGEPDEQEKKKGKKEKKPKEKKEKKPKEKKEKKPKEKKPKKEKEPKPPKEPDLTPPLPKKPVILTFVMVGSFLVLIMTGINLFGYSSSISNAASAYELGKNVETFQEISGLEIKATDQDAYVKYKIMANVASEYSAYQSFMEAKLYDMALDSLIRAVGRSEKYSEDAESYGCTSELEKIRSQAAGALSSFGISEEQALELYALDDQETYSIEIYHILTQAGLG